MKLVNESKTKKTRVKEKNENEKITGTDENFDHIVVR
jgi:hypothetical protein